LPETTPTPAPKRRQVTTVQATAASTVDAADYSPAQIVQDLRTLEKHLSEVQGSMVTAYEALAATQTATNTAIAELSTRVAELATQRGEDAAFIAGQKAVELARIHDREIEAAVAQGKATAVLEYQAEKKQLEEQTARGRDAANRRDNKVLTIMITTLGTAAGSIGVYLITGVGHQTGTTTALASAVIVLLVLVAVGLAARMKLEW
jgi:myosin heavy subunit